MRIMSLLLVALGMSLISMGLQEETVTARIAVPPKVEAELELDQTLELYFYACDMVKAKFPKKAAENCPVSPIALFTTLPRSQHGEYDPGSRIVWLNSAFTNQSQISTFGEGVAVHEMVHYILWDYEIYQDEKDYCREEDLAWASADRWVESRGRPEDMNPEWWEWYPTCDNATDDPRPVLKKVIDFIIQKTT